MSIDRRGPRTLVSISTGDSTDKARREFQREQHESKCPSSNWQTPQKGGWGHALGQTRKHHWETGEPRLCQEQDLHSIHWRQSLRSSCREMVWTTVILVLSFLPLMSYVRNYKMHSLLRQTSSVSLSSSAWYVQMSWINSPMSSVFVSFAFANKPALINIQILYLNLYFRTLNKQCLRTFVSKTICK